MVELELMTNDLEQQQEQLGDKQEQQQPPPPPAALNVVYCEICTLPPEYCEYGTKFKKCREWLEKQHPDLFSRLYSQEALDKRMANMSIKDKERFDRERAKQQRKEEQQDDREHKKKAESRVQIKRVERNKRKFITIVAGLDHFGIDLKKVAKEFGKKFATGSSVTKAATGVEEITIQGDVSYDVQEYLETNYRHQIPDGNIEIVEQKPIKKGTK